MKKNNLVASSAAAIVAIVAIGGFAVSSFAYQGDPNVEGPNYTEERHEAMMDSFENNDYQAWLEARGDIGRGHMMDVVNEDNFDQFVKMHNLRLAGDIEALDEIRAELGLGQGNRAGGHGMRGEQRGKSGGERGQNRQGGFVDADGDGNCDNMQ
jgi:hypothetical protein